MPKVKKVKKTLEEYLDEGYYQHPKHKNYVANKEDVVINVKTNKMLNGSINSSGYKELNSGKLCIMKHKFIYEAIHNEIVDSKTHDIDHIDSDKLNNHSENLQKLTKQEHANKTHLGKKRTKPVNLGKKVMRYKLDNNNKKYDITEYDSVTIAAKENKPPTDKELAKVGTGTILKVLKNKNSAYGYFWDYVVEDDIKDEIWEDLSKYWKIINPGASEEENDFIGYHLSNMGRLKNPKNMILKGQIKNGYNYCDIKYKRYLAHILVCTVFNGKKPSDVHTVDHIDKNRINNKHTNLRWFSPKEQTVHAIGIPIIAYKNGEKVGEYVTFVEAGEELGMHPSGISRCINGHIDIYKGYTFTLK